MASANHLKALLSSHIDGDEQRFFSVAMQLAAHEARLGHGQLAEEIRTLIDQAKQRHGLRLRSADSPIPISRPRGELSGLLAVSYPQTRLSNLVLEPRLAGQLERVLKEHKSASRIVEHGLSPRRKLLLVGPPGTGKTMTAAALAGELGIPLLQVRLDGLLTKFMGEAAAKLRQVFDTTAQTRGVYFFDEFDAIGSQRGLLNDVGEIRRILNSFLQMIEQDASHSLIIAATNHPDILDQALFRRFDDVLHYSLPTSKQVAAILRTKLGAIAPKKTPWAKLALLASGFSYAELARTCDDIFKDVLMSNRKVTALVDIQNHIRERKQTLGYLSNR